MNNFLKKTIYLILLLTISTTVYADTAKQVDFLLAGYRHPTTDEVLSGGKVWTFLDGTSTMSPLYTDKDQGGAATNPIILDSSGKAEVYGNKIYKFVIYDTEDNIVETINGAEYITIEDGVKSEISETDVDTIADLRAIVYTPEDGAEVSVLGYSTKGDGGGQSVYWDESSVETDNRVTIFKVSSITTGRFKSIDKSILNIKHAGAVCDGTTDDSTAISAADTVGTLTIPAPTNINTSMTLSSTPVFLTGGYINVSSGSTLNIPCPDDTDQYIFSIDGTLNFTNINKYINFLWFKSDSNTNAQAVEAAIDAAKTLQVIKIYNPDGVSSIDLDGLTISKRVVLDGSTRVGGFISGSISITQGGAASVFQNIGFKSPTSGALFDIVGSGGMDFRDCRLDAGTGNYVFSWDRDTVTPATIEFMQCNIVSGQLINAIGSTPQTYEIHFKEGCLIAIDESEWMDADNGNYCKVVIYNTLVSVGTVTNIATSNYGVCVIRESSIDDNTAGIFATNGGTPGSELWDTLDMSNCIMSTDTSNRQEFVKSIFYGSGITSKDKYITMITTGGYALDANQGLEEFYFDGSGDVTLTGDVVYSVAGGLYDGQEITVYIIDNTIPGAYSANFFGLVGAGVTIEKTVIRLKFINGTWEVYRIGDKAVI